MSRRFAGLPLLLVLFLLVGAAACGDDNDNAATTTTDAPFDIDDEGDNEEEEEDDDSSGDEPSAGGEADPEDWTADVCGAMTTWLQGIQTSAGNIGSPQSPEEGRDVLVAFLDEAVTLTEDMIEEIDEAGAPDVDDGEAVAAALRVNLNRAKTIFEDARDSAEQLPVDDPNAFQEAATQIQADIEEGSTELGETFDRLESEFDIPELDEAFASEPACQELEASSETGTE